LLFSASLTLQICPPLAAQGSSDPPRKVRVAVRPEYSDLARRLNLSGTVRVEVVIAPTGKVKTAKVIGGNPVLGQEALRAASLTEFEPGTKETTQVLEFSFERQ
jgi:TonB family protein